MSRVLRVLAVALSPCSAPVNFSCSFIDCKYMLHFFTTVTGINLRARRKKLTADILTLYASLETEGTIDLVRFDQPPLLLRTINQDCSVAAAPPYQLRPHRSCSFGFLICINILLLENMVFLVLSQLGPLSRPLFPPKSKRSFTGALFQPLSPIFWIVKRAEKKMFFWRSTLLRRAILPAK